MLRWKVRDGQPPRQVECEKKGYPHKDAEGDTQYDNTCFDDEAQAWEKALVEAAAGVELDTTDLFQAKRQLIQRIDAHAKSIEELREMMLKAEAAGFPREIPGRKRHPMFGPPKEGVIAKAAEIRHPRTHAELRKDITVDPIFLLQRRRILYTEACPYSWDSDLEQLSDDDGKIVTPERCLEEGYAVEVWETDTVFLTRADGEEYGRARAYHYPDGWRVYCIAARGDLAYVLGEATVEGRYS